ncbi:helix-turn-helix domain-containing protein [Luteolibacter pohnpeiensis]|uniref:Helix-turn-helix domain-containing protein n=1 Tax=Luteolibacter pohnpeiensis TaxID=454153 RepID=A0A934S9Y3_9BACT|nr:helix-turn-helix domain-containing protein [Luteolibacter pohnpeiensis]MBK1883591.1 helix-turn-helix domain-containing protein [Luteolibacter pohnpeiensis]
MKRVLKIGDWFHPDGFPISVERREPQAEFGLHSHEFAELIIVTGGRCTHVSGSEVRELTAGDVIVITGKREHEYRDVEDLRLVNILYQPDRIGMSLLDLPSVAGYHVLFTQDTYPNSRRPSKRTMRLAAGEMARILELVGRLERELQERDPGFGLMATSNFMQIIGTLSRIHGRNPSPDGKALLRIGEVLTHLEQNITSEVNLDELAAIAHMSGRTFLRVFSSATGTSPLTWLIGRRITRACNLLRQTERSITEIAFEVGFNDSNYFTRQFRKVTGFSPREYRRHQRDG